MMEKIDFGVKLLLVSAIIYGSALIANAIYAVEFHNFSMELKEIVAIPLTIASITALAGIYVIIYAIKKS
ncbi:hypothetical protein SAMN05216232_0595 [Virgibacillus subterraneus]|uniref:Uncharacterized protein n=2 Tax=Virgibacillus TaxID=84406 RepID=A0A1H0Y7A0_9BACI|nr:MULTISPECIES: hypothetical protein [Virgibacillus]SDQ10943.1 hypothetical protein SAMN05216231_0465 [Virgibacillus salinus]SEP69142.1 hypothetical protein SAMN05216232_0595 [Virgibacillus subterraneus]